MIPSEKLSDALRRKRKKTDNTQQKLSDLTGLSVTQISRIENNDTNYSHTNAYQLWKTLKQLEKDYKTAHDVMKTPIEWASPKDTVLEVKKKMKENDYSQLPVKKNGKHTGRINTEILMDLHNPDEKIADYKGPAYSEVGPDTPAQSIKQIVKDDSAVLVKQNGEYLGLVTIADII